MSSHNKPNWFEQNPKKTLAVVFIIGFLAIDFGAAAFLKLIGKFEPSYVTSSIREAYYRKAHPVYHHTLAANVNNYSAEWGGRNYQINTNSLGFKDATAKDIPMQTDKQRIVIIGDSFTEGVGVEYPDTFVGMLASHFPQLDILNAAATSYSPIIYYRKLKYLIETNGLKFDEVWVFIDLSDMEDEALAYKFDAQQNVVSRNSLATVSAVTQTADLTPVQHTPPMSVKEFFTQYTVILGQLRNLSAYIKSLTRPWDRSLNQRRSLWTIDKNIYAEYGDIGIQSAVEHMTELHALLESNNIKMTIAVYPWPDQIFHKDLDSMQVKLWEEWANIYKVRFVNLFPVFINDEVPDDIIANNFLAGDVHWNKTGHTRIFQTLQHHFE